VYELSKLYCMAVLNTPISKIKPPLTEEEFKQFEAYKADIAETKKNWPKNGPPLIFEDIFDP
jgi:hypothetical protein